jgi:hypothetical protein
MSGFTTKQSLTRLVGVLAMLGGLSGVAQAAGIKIEDVDATVKSESAIIQGAVQAESTAVQNAVGAVQTELTTQHGMIEQGVDDNSTDIAEVKALVEALAPGAPVSVCPAGGTADASGRYVTYAASTLDPIHVCDMNSGLFWEQSPSGSVFTLSPDTATPHCAALGPDWRVPEIRELVGLVDTTFNNPVANTSVFSNVQSSLYWSATSYATNPAVAWRVSFNDGNVFTLSKTLTINVWCARSGS